MTTTETTNGAFELKAFDRNRYFYGKLMTARDFAQEQAYFNSKRWLINRLLFGSGVVCGLDVSGGGPAPQPLVVKPGVAIDAHGREIIVAAETKVKIADLLAGLRPAVPPDLTGARDFRLCISYQECPQEPVPAMKGSACEQICDFNRVREGFSFKLREAPPAPTPPTPCDRWMNRRRQAGAGQGVEVERLAPLWVRPGEVFEVAVKVTARTGGADLVGVSLAERVRGSVPGDNPVLIEPQPTGPPDFGGPRPTGPATPDEQRTMAQGLAVESQPTRPSHLGGPQFPTVPVTLRDGEFFVYVYQV
ncbi:MAG: hypothetical protein M3416_21780, partial [Acidobacteriota bacterium]|nr:hypothetical protein [Acidobacteriota bacterium]